MPISFMKTFSSLT